jgi:Virulence factor
MATYQILYWHEVPSQIKVEDGEDEVKLELSSKFQERIDQLATQRGLHGTDDYLAGWNWGDELERDGSAQEVAQQLQAELEAAAAW